MRLGVGLKADKGVSMRKRTEKKATYGRGDGRERRAHII